MIESKQNILGSFCYIKSYLSPVGAFSMVQDEAINLLTKMNLSGIVLKEKYNAMWVIVKNKIKFFKTIMWGDEVKLKTFISSKSLVKLNVFVQMFNTKEELLMQAKVELCALSCENGRIQKLCDVGMNEVQTFDGDNMEFDNFNLDEKTIVAERKVCASNIDLSNHTNNVEYIRFLVDTYNSKELLEREIEEIEICYQKQTYEGNTLFIAKNKKQNEDIFAILKDDEIAVKTKFKFKK